MQLKHEKKKNFEERIISSVVTVRTLEGVAKVESAFHRSPTRSAYRLAASLSICDRSLRRSSPEHPHYHPNKEHTLKGGAH